MLSVLPPADVMGVYLAEGDDWATEGVVRRMREQLPGAAFVDLPAALTHSFCTSEDQSRAVALAVGQQMAAGDRVCDPVAGVVEVDARAG